MRNVYGHVVIAVNQSHAFRIFHSAFYFPFFIFRILHFRILLTPCIMGEGSRERDAECGFQFRTILEFPKFREFFRELV